MEVTDGRDSSDWKKGKKEGREKNKFGNRFIYFGFGHGLDSHLKDLRKFDKQVIRYVYYKPRKTVWGGEINI